MRTDLENSDETSGVFRGSLRRCAHAGFRMWQDRAPRREYDAAAGESDRECADVCDDADAAATHASAGCAQGQRVAGSQAGTGE